jgi:hypothetical protein
VEVTVRADCESITLSITITADLERCWAVTPPSFIDCAEMRAFHREQETLRSSRVSTHNNQTWLEDNVSSSRDDTNGDPRKSNHRLNLKLMSQLLNLPSMCGFADQHETYSTWHYLLFNIDDSIEQTIVIRTASVLTGKDGLSPFIVHTGINIL